jgi:hypothetical protein
MMSGVRLETCWAFTKLWNNKFYYKAVFCWYFYWIIVGITAHRYLNGAVKGLREEDCFIALSWFVEREILLVFVPLYEYKSSHAVVMATVAQYLNYSLRIRSLFAIANSFFFRPVLHGNSHSTASKDFLIHVTRLDFSGNNPVRVLPSVVC